VGQLLVVVRLCRGHCIARTTRTDPWSDWKRDLESAQGRRSDLGSVYTVTVLITLIPDLYRHLLGATVIEIWDQRAKSERVKFWEPLSENPL